jgi:hypothetical protein
MSPNTSLTCSRGTTQNIGWVYSGKPGTTVKITLEKSGTLVHVLVDNYEIYQQIENFGNYVWNIPNNLTPGSDYKIKVQGTNTQYMDTSDQPFTIKQLMRTQADVCPKALHN